ncbi:hypothetical protein JMJ35_002079 [Cladonia borealis]|uniref:Uncharacterized protein n=1 Tax=Cladonia borealis TaxID=184061 RepID=A0AA39V9N3_9LECA|nr:hypothetical protein JMJ35_002079 [Cladonia borealis]
MHVNVLSHHMQLPVHTRPKEVFQKPASFHPSSISASAEHAKELATHDGSFLAIGLLTLFESACLSLRIATPYWCFSSLSDTFLNCFPTAPNPHQTRPFSWAGRALVFTRLDWNGSLRSLRIWRYSLKCAESLTLWLRFTSNFIKLPVYTTTGTLMVSNGAVILIH